MRKRTRKSLLVGLDVDVRGALLDGVDEDEVHQLDDRRVLGAALEVDRVVVLVAPADLDVGVVEALHHLFIGGAGGVVALGGLLDGLLGRDHDLDVVAGEELDVVDGEDVRGVAHRQDERGGRPVHRDHVVLLAHLPGDQLDHLGVDVEVPQVDRRDPVLLGEEPRQLVLLDVAELGQVVAEPATLLLLIILRLLQLLQGDEVLPHQELTETARHAFSRVEWDARANGTAVGRARSRNRLGGALTYPFGSARKNPSHLYLLRCRARARRAARAIAARPAASTGSPVKRSQASAPWCTRRASPSTPGWPRRRAARRNGVPPWA